MSTRTAGQIAHDSRKARIATSLVQRGYLTPEEAKFAAGVLIGRGVSVRQVEAAQPGIETRRHLLHAITLARKVVGQS